MNTKNKGKKRIKNHALRKIVQDFQKKIKIKIM